MSEYQAVKIGKLKLKGSSSAPARKRKKRPREEKPTEVDVVIDPATVAMDTDCQTHGGWWSVTSLERLEPGNFGIQLSDQSYLFAVDNGTLTSGARGEDSARSPEEAEVFSLLRIDETKIALKSGYGKYVSVNARGDVLARSDAVGPQEQMTVVIEDGKVALQGHNGYFLAQTTNGELKSISSSVKERELVKLRTNAPRVKKKKVSETADEVENLRKFEVVHAKLSQSYGGSTRAARSGKLQLHEGPTSSLELAQRSGRLHEAMLDRREKQKADRYCK